MQGRRRGGSCRSRQARRQSHFHSLACNQDFSPSKLTFSLAHSLRQGAMAQVSLSDASSCTCTRTCVCLLLVCLCLCVCSIRRKGLACVSENNLCLCLRHTRHLRLHSPCTCRTSRPRTLFPASSTPPGCKASCQHPFDAYEAALLLHHCRPKLSLSGFKVIRIEKNPSQPYILVVAGRQNASLSLSDAKMIHIHLIANIYTQSLPFLATYHSKRCPFQDAVVP